MAGDIEKAGRAGAGTQGGVVRGTVEGQPGSISLLGLPLGRGSFCKVQGSLIHGEEGRGRWWERELVAIELKFCPLWVGSPGPAGPNFGVLRSDRRKWGAEFWGNYSFPTPLQIAGPSAERAGCGFPHRSVAQWRKAREQWGEKLELGRPQLPAFPLTHEPL